MFDIALLEKKIIAESTIAFIFAKPEGFIFTAGQHVIMKLTASTEITTKVTHLFTIASAPHEKHLMFAMRIRDTVFKKTIKEMPVGSEVKIAGPLGNFILHADESVPAVCLAGGIGITPFRSMIIHAMHGHSSMPLMLFYANRRPEEAAFLEELLSLNKPPCLIIPTMTRLSDNEQSWKGETGHIALPMLQKYIPDIILPHYYCAGPPAFVKAMASLLETAGIDSQQLHVDEFSGYS
jgi:ferredoxin-NADP reductase